MNFARGVALISVTLGTLALIISLSVLGGFDKMLKENAVKFTSHISTVTFNRKPIADYDGISAKLKYNFPDISGIMPVIEREGLISSKDYVEGVMIRGFQPDNDITQLKRNIMEGKFSFSSDRSKEIVIGKRLARKLNAGVGDIVVVYAMTETQMGTMGYPDINKFKIVGIYETGMAKYDDIAVFVPLKTANTIFRIPENSSTGFEIILDDINKAIPFTEKIQDFLGYPFFCLSVFVTHSSIFAWIDLQKEPIPIVLGLISIVAIFNIITILLITVVEKTRTIGILSTLGMNKREIMSVFILQGTTVGITGTIAGAIISLVLSLLQQNFHLITLKGDIYFLDTLPVLISLWNYLIVGGISIALSFLATLIPAYIAVRISPVRAIRYK